ncbi:MAG: AAA family ATPase [Deltaproteobacteria bacterium]|nr:MAG: AAA family ATPase [Deltaproteobacteria bacterium]
MNPSDAPPQDRIDEAMSAISILTGEIQRAIIGQKELVRGVITGLLCNGNLLLEGEPGLGKTLLVKVLAEAVQLQFSRIQFTPDLMPADITGTQSLLEDASGRGQLVFQPGPIFSNIVLADEINRATPKTQSALLEAMQEKAVTVAGDRLALDEPFVVIATQNPIEMEGTYPLPEAQLDRFLLKLTVPYPSFEVLKRIGMQTTGTRQVHIRPVMQRSTLLGLQRLVREVVVASNVADLAARLVLATHPHHHEAPSIVKRFVRYGASPRAMQAMLLAGRAEALMSGRPWVDEADLRAVALAVLQHRIGLAFEAELEGVGPKQVVQTVLESISTAGPARVAAR